MAQTEEMLRLLKNGKIVGYEWTTKENITNNIFTYRSKNHNFPSDLMGWVGLLNKRFVSLEYDSFERGVKIAGKWWFEGDKGEDKILEHVAKHLQRENRIFKIYQKNDFLWYKEYSPADYELITSDYDLKYSEHIGTIHDKQKVI